jgi:hypothetical protein
MATDGLSIGAAVIKDLKSLGFSLPRGGGRSKSRPEKGLRKRKIWFLLYHVEVAPQLGQLNVPPDSSRDSSIIIIELQ